MSVRRRQARFSAAPVRQRPALRWAWLLVPALAWAMAWGAWHRTAHAWPEAHQPGAAPAWGLAAGPIGPAAWAGDDGASSAETLHTLQAWEHPAGGDDCRLIDHLMWADALSASALLLALPPAAPVHVATPGAAGHSARACPGYQARAPPRG
jgi:hypothetical protein